MTKITGFTKEFWKTVAECKGSPVSPTILRDYEIVQDRKRGLSCGQLAIKYGISCTMVMKILNQYD